MRIPVGLLEAMDRVLRDENRARERANRKARRGRR